MQDPKDLYAQVLNNGPSQGTFFVLLNEMKQQGRSREALQFCLKALRIYPEDIHLKRLLTECFLEVGFSGEAERALKSLTNQLDDLAEVYRLQGKLLMEQNRRPEAMSSLRIYLAHRPDDLEAQQLLSQLESPAADVASDESPSFENALSGESKDEDAPAELATPTLAEIYFKQGQIDEAIKTYERVLGENPEDEASLARLAELKAMSEPASSVEGTLEEALVHRKQRMISTLEGWLTRVQELGRVG